jgi:clan AA aspartic protease
MTGKVDQSGRALLRMRLRHPTSAVVTETDGWVDTGFSGDLVLPQTLIVALGLPRGQAGGAVLADGSQIVVDTWVCFLEWFGEWKESEVVGTTGQIPLIGIGLLRNHELCVNYRTGTVAVD